MLDIDSESNKGEVTQNILADKENTTQFLKKKLEIPPTQLIQASELTEMEKEKDLLASELSDNKENLLRLVDEKKGWEKEKALLVEKNNVLK